MLYRAILIDDEQPARERLRSLLQNYMSTIKVIGEAQDGPDALKKIEGLKPDLLFLDIRLPEMDAFTLIEHFSYEPHIIFVTAFDSYAVKAFESAALDYLVKPVEPGRLASSIDRLQKSKNPISVRNAAEIAREKMYQEALTRIQIRTGNEIRFLPVQEIVFFEAEDYYSAVNTADGRYLIRYSLSELELRLIPEQFVRIHRSCIVNISRIKKLRATLKNGSQIILDTPHSEPLSVSRRYLKRVREILNGVVYF
jgi:two-component system LytT family response regulator